MSFPPVNTQEIYRYRPGSTKVHRITEYETGQAIHPPAPRWSPARWLRKRVPEHIIAALAAVRRAGERDAKHCSFVCEPDRKG